MSMTYTQVKSTAPDEIQLNAGLILSDFTPETGAYDPEDILGATTSGISFSATPSYKDFGSDIDNCPNGALEFQEIENVEVKLTATFLSVTDALAKMLAGAADISAVTSSTHDVSKITPRKTLDDSDYEDVWVVGDRGKGGKGYVAIHIMNGLNVGGFQMQTTDKGKGHFAVEIRGHYSINDPDEVPYEIFIGTEKN